METGWFPSCFPSLLRSYFLPCGKPMLDIPLQKLRDHRRKRDEEHDADDAEQLSAQQRGQQCPQRGKPHAAADHMRVDELVFDELHRLINKKAQYRLSPARPAA